MAPTNGIGKFDKTFMERVLRERLKDETIKVVEIDAKQGASRVANFFSDIFRLSLRYTKSSENGRTDENAIDVVVKCEPLNARASLEICRQQNFFGIESMIYRDVLPKIEKLTSQKIGPELVYASDDFGTIILEDLAVDGYEMVDRQKGLSLKHCTLVLTKMAIFHAASVALCEKDPKLSESLRNGILANECSESYLKMIEVSMQNVSREVRDWSNGRYREPAKKLEKLAGRIREDVARVYERDSDEFCVINHGDCWINNILFKNDERGEPCDVLLVDYQMSVYSSPAIDLQYFLRICPENDLKCDKDDYFLNVYLTCLIDAMNATGCVTKPPTMKDLKLAMHKRRAYAIYAGIVLYPRMVANEEDCESFQQVYDELNGVTRMPIFKREEAVVAVRKMLPFMNERGYLD